MNGNVDNALLFLINSLFGLYLAVLILRISLQLVRADFYNPLAQFIWQVTQPLLQFPARYIPRWRNLDITALLFLWLLAIINIWLDIAILGWGSRVNAAHFVVWPVFKLIILALNLFSFCILAQAILSWVGPGAHGPASSLLWSINEPFLRPVRRYIPPLGGLDISPLIVILGLQVLARLIPLHYLLR